MSNENKFYKLINEYGELKDELMDHEANLHDGMYWDIQGYIEYFEFECTREEEKDIIDDLNKQVKACRKLLKGYQELKYIFC